MDDTFYHSTGQVLTPQPKTSRSNLIEIFLSIPPALLVTLLLAPILVVIATRLTSERPSQKKGAGKGKTVRRLPYWFPRLGNAVSILQDHDALKRESAQSDGIFALKFRDSSYIVVSNPSLVEDVLAKTQSVDQLKLGGWNVATRFFGLSNRSKYDVVWKDLNEQVGKFVRGPERSLLVLSTAQILQTNIPQMISFVKAEIDLQPWERSANVKTVSSTEVQADLMTLIRDMMCNAAIPAVFGRGLLDKYPNVLEDVFTMDDGLSCFLLGLPPLTPWPGVMQTHLARKRLWGIMDEQQIQLDKKATGEETDYSWGDFDDVSKLILERNRLWKEHDFAVKERADLTVLFTVATTVPYLAAWHMFYIHSIPNLTSSIRAELAPHVIIEAPTTIGKFSSPPALKLPHVDVLKSCQLFRSTYREALRLTSRDWLLRTTHEDIKISGGLQKEEYTLRKGENILCPHALVLHDPVTFSSPDQFIADRFIVSLPDNPGDVDSSVGTTELFKDSTSMFGATDLMEEVCLSFAAGVLMMWDIEPVVNERGRKDWKIPKLGTGNGIARPVGDVRASIKQREFMWDQQ